MYIHETELESLSESLWVRLIPQNLEKTSITQSVPSLTQCGTGCSLQSFSEISGKLGRTDFL